MVLRYLQRFEYCHLCKTNYEEGFIHLVAISEINRKIIGMFMKMNPYDYMYF